MLSVVFYYFTLQLLLFLPPLLFSGFIGLNTEKTTKEVNVIKRRTNYITFLPTGQFSYLNRPTVHLYGSLAGGIIFLDATEKGVDTNLIR